MACNIEIKAQIESVASLAKIVAKLSTEGPTEILQDDTFFQCATGRMKLRSFVDGTGQLIFYRRENQRGPKESFYHLTPTTCANSLRETLTLAYGQVGRVRKQRTLFTVGRALIHLDSVESIGDFMELEVVLGDNDSTEDGVNEAMALMVRLGVQPDQLVEEAYVDLLSKAASNHPHEPVAAEVSVAAAPILSASYCHFLEVWRENPATTRQIKLLSLIVSVLQASQDCIGAAILGSFAKGSADRVSDVDLIIFCTEGTGSDLMKLVRAQIPSDDVFQEFHGSHAAGSPFQELILYNFTSFEFHAISPTEKFTLKQPFVEIFERSQCLQARRSDKQAPTRDVLVPYRHGDSWLPWELFNCMKWLSRGEASTAKNYLVRLGAAIESRKNHSN